MKAFSKKEILEGNHKEIIIYGTGVLGEIALAGMRLLGMEPNLFVITILMKHRIKGSQYYPQTN